ncbi:hypothetical protein CNR22_12690 [Sphingobacteriaceae bacterium]|nr:hypothetical protein CNR22_12690 [Sphingobacteriaceae bacterium]
MTLSIIQKNNKPKTLTIMKTKLILMCFLALTVIASAQWTTPAVNKLTTVKDRVGINFGGPASWLPSHPFHVIETSDTTCGYFILTASQSGNDYITLTGRAEDPNGMANYLIGVRDEGFNGSNNFGGAFTAGNAFGSGGVTIGCYGKLNPITGANSAGICTGVYGDDWSTGGSGGAGPNWGGFFVGDVYSTTNFYPSDRQLKNDIKPLQNALDKIMSLKPSTYVYKYQDFKGLSLPRVQQMGLIAQELEEVFPDLVKETAMPERSEDGTVIASGKTFKTINYVSLIPVLISAVQEQQKQIAEQREMINDLTQKMANTTGLNEINAAGGFNMSQNEPNPFNGETVVNYVLPKQVKTASLIVYDLSGKQITTFPITDRETSSLTITSEKLAAGIYIYSIIADNKIVDSKRMVVANK